MAGHDAHPSSCLMPSVMGCLYIRKEYATRSVCPVYFSPFNIFAFYNNIVCTLIQDVLHYLSAHLFCRLENVLKGLKRGL